MSNVEIILSEPDPDTTGWKVPCEVWSRVVGYMTPVQQWNKGKQQEFADRKTFDAENTANRSSGNPDYGVFSIDRASPIFPVSVSPAFEMDTTYRVPYKVGVK